MRPISRRDFLKRSGYAAFGVAALSNAWLVQACGDSGNEWDELAEKLNGQLLRPGDGDYASTGLSENTLVADIRPSGIALCADAQDVQTSIRWARENDMALVAQSGGHSYGGYSTTEGLMISVRPMDSVDLDSSSGIATVGSGVQLGNLYSTLFPQGVFVPAGRCKSVGVAGFVLGGGFGFETRQLGLTSDRLLETQIVTADGELLTCNENENADLFWACRGGGGGNFGINTSFTLQTAEVMDVTYGKVEWSFEDAEAVWPVLDNMAITAPDAMGMRNGITRSRSAPGEASTDSITALFIYFGPEDEARDVLAPALNVAAPTATTIMTGTIADATSSLALKSSPNGFLAKSGYGETPFPAEGIGKIMDFFARWPDSSRAAVFDLHSVGGVSNEVGRTDTAYVHRGAQVCYEFEVDWFEGASEEEIAESTAWLEAFGAALQPYFNGEAYLNFIDPSLADWPQQYYAENFDRLVEVKRQYDPDNVFNFGKSIPV